jgi:hypothetical protein
MKFVNANKPHRKSRDVGHPSICYWLRKPQVLFPNLGRYRNLGPAPLH